MKSKSWFSPLAWIVGAAVLWESAARFLDAGLRDPMAASKLPYLHAVLGAMALNASSLAAAAWVTLSKAAAGFALGAAVGYCLALAMSLSKAIERIAFPYLIVSQMIPVLGLAPIIFVLVRDMDASRVVIAAFITFFPVAANSLAGFKSVDDEKRQLMRSCAAGTAATYAKTMVPFSLPYLFAGLKIAAPLSVTASILVDMLGSRSGIGVKLLYSLYGGNDSLFWASVLTSAAMGMASFLLVLAAEKLLMPWKASGAAAKGASA